MKSWDASLKVIVPVLLGSFLALIGYLALNVATKGDIRGAKKELFIRQLAHQIDTKTVEERLVKFEIVTLDYLIRTGKPKDVGDMKTKKSLLETDLGKINSAITSLENDKRKLELEE